MLFNAPTDLGYENDMQPILDIVRVVYQLKKPEFSGLISKYGPELFSDQGLVEYNNTLMTYTTMCYDFLSDKYTNRILSKYYSTAGSLAIIRDALNTLFKHYYSESYKS